MSDPSNHQPPKSIWPIFVIGMLMIALFWIGSQALLNLPEPAEEEDAARSAERAQAYEELQAANQEKLSSFAVLDENRVQVPIDLAMRLAQERLNAGEPAPSGPVNPPVPAIPPVPTETAPAAETSDEPAEQEAAPSGEAPPESPAQPTNGEPQP